MLCWEGSAGGEGRELAGRGSTIGTTREREIMETGTPYWKVGQNADVKRRFLETFASDNGGALCLKPFCRERERI